MGEWRSPFPATGKKEQSCPICGSHLAAGALYCEHCGTDLSRTGVLFSTDVRPLSASRRGGRGLRWVLAGVVGLASGAVVLALVGGLPSVSARVPTLRALRVAAAQTLQRAVGWGKDRIAHQPVPSGEALPPPEAASAGPPKSSLTILSTPVGATVYLDGRQAGTTPLVIDLAPGTYRVKVARPGYTPAVRTVELGVGEATVEVTLAALTPRPPPRSSPPPAAVRRAAPPPPPARPPEAVGRPAPPFSLKDRLGVIYRLEAYRGQRMAILFVWDLDADAQRAVRDLDERMRRAPALGGLVVVMRADRLAVRSFLATWPVRVPLLFGTPQVARQYQLTPGVLALYVVSEQGTVERVYTGPVRPLAVR
jgi:hypothetical protein